MCSPMTKEERQASILREQANSAKAYKIHGYDQVFGDKYVEDKEYATKEEAQKRCRRMEWVEVSA